MTLFFCAVLLFTISNLNAKTIWIVDLTNNHSSMVTFYNTLIEDLKLTKYKQHITIVTDKKQIKEQVGDIAIELSGQGFSTNTGNLTYTTWIGCTIDKCKEWAYKERRTVVFSDDNTYQQARLFRNDIVEFLDNNF